MSPEHRDKNKLMQGMTLKDRSMALMQLTKDFGLKTKKVWFEAFQ